MKRNDVLLLVVIAVCAVLVFFCYRLFFSGSGDYVRIEVDGTLLETFPLDTDTVYTIQTENGENILEIKDGAASIISADCPDKLCVHQKNISADGETLICLPHKVVVSVISSDASEFDAIAS